MGRTIRQGSFPAFPFYGKGEVYEFIKIKYLFYKQKE